MTIKKGKKGKSAATVAVEMPDGGFLNINGGDDVVR
jgi:hypothetical protein